jgi:predicted dehydrogenase
MKVGLLGFGNIGKIHANAYHLFQKIDSGLNQNPIISTIFDPYNSPDRDLMQDLGFPKIANSMEEFFDSELDMVDICSPTYLHFEHIKHAIDKNLAIYCEKPITAQIKNTQYVVQKTNEKQLPTHSAFVYRYFEAIQKAKQLFDSKKLGKIYHFRLTLFYGGYIDQNKSITWRLKKETSGGGALADLGIHLFDLLQYLIGTPQWIQNTLHTFIPQRPNQENGLTMERVDVEDWSHCIVKCQDGIHGSIEVSRVSCGMKLGFEILVFCEKGTVQIKPGDVQNIHIYEQEKGCWNSTYTLSPNSEQQKILYPFYQQDIPPILLAHFLSIFDFANSIEHQQNSELSFENTYKNHQLIDAAYRSAEKS